MLTSSSPGSKRYRRSPAESCTSEEARHLRARLHERHGHNQQSFEPYYRTTILSRETDPNKLHDLKADLDGYQVYAWPDVEALVKLYVNGADRDKLDPILDTCVTQYVALDENGQVDFKGKAKAFVRTYGFLASILPYSIASWEMLSIFLNFLTPKLPAPKEEDLARGLLETIDMDSYRLEAQTAIAIALADQDVEIEPVRQVGEAAYLSRSWTA